MPCTNPQGARLRDPLLFPHHFKDLKMNQELTNNPFNPLTPPKVFDEIKVSLASPERILSWSYGEINGFIGKAILISIAMNITCVNSNTKLNCIQKS